MIDQAAYSRASSLIHLIHGTAVLILGLCGTYAAPGGRKWLRALGPAALLAAGLGGLAVILVVLGGFSPAAAAKALALRKGFHIFVSLSFLFMAGGLSGLMAFPEGRAGERWFKVFAGFLAAIAALYLLLPWRVNEIARHHALVPHFLAGGTMLLGLLAGMARHFTGRVVLMRVAAAFFIIAAVQLMWYREVPEAYGPMSFTFTSEDADVSDYTSPARP